MTSTKDDAVAFGTPATAIDSKNIMEKRAAESGSNVKQDHKEVMAGSCGIPAKQNFISGMDMYDMIDTTP